MNKAQAKGHMNQAQIEGWMNQAQIEGWMDQRIDRYEAGSLHC
jgi:hypothetical protein